MTQKLGINTNATLSHHNLKIERLNILQKQVNIFETYKMWLIPLGSIRKIRISQRENVPNKNIILAQEIKINECILIRKVSGI